MKNTLKNKEKFTKKVKHICCYSGGHASALVAIEVVRRFGKENVILLNHNINVRYEDIDIKRFKKEVADYLDLPITYKNYKDLPAENLPSQFDVSVEAGSFINPATRQALCTHRLKTSSFHRYLAEYFVPNSGDCIAYYGFDEKEFSRVDRRKSILNDMGYNSDYPTNLWGEGRLNKLKDYFTKKGLNAESILKTERYENRDKFKRTIFNTNEIGIKLPNTYSNYKHANCKGCLKAGRQHWYVVYCLDYSIFCEGKDAEEKIGYSIIKGDFLRDLEPKFKKMKELGIEPSEKMASQTFWAKTRKLIKKDENINKPCDCSF